MATLATLRVAFTADTQQFIRETEKTARQAVRLRRALHNATRPLENMARHGRRASIALAGLTAAIGVGVARTTQYARQMRTAAEQTGVAIEAIQRLGHAAGETNIEFSTLQTALRGFARRSAEAAAGNQQFLRGFERIGISQSEVAENLHDIEGLFLRVADGIAELGTTAEQSATAMMLMSDAGRQMIPLLSRGGSGIREFYREAEQLGLVLSKRTVLSFDLLGREIDTTRQRFSVASQNLLAAFIPTIRLLNEWVGRAITAFQGLDDEARQNIVRGVAIVAAILGVVSALGIMAATLKAVIMIFKLTGLAALMPFAPLLIKIGLVIAAILTLRSAWENNWFGIRDAVIGAWERISPYLDLLGDWAQKTLTTAWAWSVDAFGTAYEWIQDTVLPWIANMGEAIATAWSWNVYLVGETIRWIREEAWSIINSGASTAWSWTTGAISTFVDWVRTAWNYIVNGVSTAWSWTTGALGTFVEWVYSVWQKITGGVTTAWSWTTGALSAFVEWVRSSWSSIINGVSTAWTWTTGHVSTFITWIKDEAWPFMQRQINTSWGWLTGHVSAFVNWIYDSWSYIVDGVVTAWDWTKGSIHSFIEWIVASWHWIVGGVETAWSWTRGTIDSFIEWIRDTAWPWFDGTVTTTWNFVIKGLDWLKEFWESLRSSQSVEDVGRDLADRHPAMQGYGSRVITDDERILLAALAELEAGIDGVEGMAAVVEVVFNRMEQNARLYGDTIEGVIRKAYQFEPVVTGVFDELLISGNIASSALEAVDLALRRLARSAGVTGNATYFANLDIVRQRDPNHWMLDPEKMVPTLTLGGHTFGKAGYAEGGYTGNFPTDKAVGLVHGQELVIPAPAVKKGLFGILDWLGLPGYQQGGSPAGWGDFMVAQQSAGAGNAGAITGLVQTLTGWIEGARGVLGDSTTDTVIGGLKTLATVTSTLEHEFGRLQAVIGGYEADLDEVLGQMEALKGAPSPAEDLEQEINPLLGTLQDFGQTLLEPFTPLGMLKMLLAELMPLFNALIVPLTMVAGIIATALMPVFEALFPVVKFFGQVLLKVAEWVGLAWNALLDLISLIPFVDLRNWKMDIDALREGQQELAKLTWEEAQAKVGLAEATERATQAMLNAPRGFRVEPHRYEAAGATMASLGMSSGGMSAQSGGNTTIIEDVTIVSNDPEDTWRKLKRVIQRENEGATGTSVPTAAPGLTR